MERITAQILAKEVVQKVDVVVAGSSGIIQQGKQKRGRKKKAMGKNNKNSQMPIKQISS